MSEAVVDPLDPRTGTPTAVAPVTSFPRHSLLSRLINALLRIAQVLAGVLPINRWSMAFVTAAMGLPIRVLSWRARVEVHRVDGVRVDVVTHRDLTDPQRTVFYSHGGGFVFGSTRTHRKLAEQLSRVCRARVVLYDYRLATVADVDALLSDAEAVYRWTAERYPDQSLVVAGDSAGGNLTVTLLARIGADSLPAPVAGVGISAWLDPDLQRRRGEPCDPFFSVPFATKAAALCLPGAGIRPLLGALPTIPMLLQCGADEPIRAGNEQLANGIVAAGGQAVVQVWEHQPHVFQAFAPFLAEGRESLAEINAFLDAV